jgi:LDH2 family malate/lactate/ureidoglycolate dehydrogenase
MISIAIAELEAFAERILTAAGASPDIAAEVANQIIDAEACGHVSHGLRLLPLYVSRLQSGKVSGSAKPRILWETGCLALLDASGVFGQVAGAMAVSVGIRLAQRSGIAAVATVGSGHFGRNGRWAELAADAGFASIHFINAPGSPLVVTGPGGGRPVLTSNPIALGMPHPSGTHAVLDFASGVFATNTVKRAAEAGERLDIPAIATAEGAYTDDPQAFRTGVDGILPFGGFKGYGIGLFAEMFAGLLTGGGWSPGGVGEKPANNCFSIFINATAFQDGMEFDKSVESYYQWIRSPSATGLVIPGDRARKARQTATTRGIELAGPTLKKLNSLANDLAATVPAGWAV